MEILVAGEGFKPAEFCLIATIHEHRCHYGPKKFQSILKKFLILSPDIHEWQRRGAVPVHEINF